MAKAFQAYNKPVFKKYKSYFKDGINMSEE